MLKMTRLSDLSQRDNDNKVVGGGGGKNLSKSKMSKNAKSRVQTHFDTTKEPTFLTPNTRETFNQLQ